MISEHAHVQGEVNVSHVVVNGTVAGPVRANDYVELHAKARVHGDVPYRSIEIHVGAIVQGKLAHVEAERHRSSSSSGRRADDALTQH